MRVRVWLLWPCASAAAFGALWPAGSALAAPGTAPIVSLLAPAAGAIVSGGRPVFTGTASDGPGFSSVVTVNVYYGPLASGRLAQTLTVTESSGSFSVGPSIPLVDGTYTAQAQQSDTARPSDVGTSSPVTFSIQNGGPSVTLDSPGSTPLTTATGRRIATVHVTETAGSWSLRWPKRLAPGTYTVRAVQSDDAGHSRSPSPAARWDRCA